MDLLVDGFNEFTVELLKHLQSNSKLKTYFNQIVIYFSRN
jgi:hypothetical protein